MAIYKSREGQNIFDLSLQLYGTANRVIDIFLDNPFMQSLNDDIKSGSSIEYTLEQNETRQYLIDNKIDIATNDTNQENGKGFDEGFAEGFN